MYDFCTYNNGVKTLTQYIKDLQDKNDGKTIEEIMVKRKKKFDRKETEKDEGNVLYAFYDLKIMLFFFLSVFCFF
jgi:hypothetical protein